MKNIVRLNSHEISYVCGGKYRKDKAKPSKAKMPSKLPSIVLDLTYDLPMIALLTGAGISIHQGCSKTATAWFGIASYSAAEITARYARNYFL